MVIASIVSYILLVILLLLWMKFSKIPIVAFVTFSLVGVVAKSESCGGDSYYNSAYIAGVAQRYLYGSVVSAEKNMMHYAVWSCKKKSACVDYVLKACRRNLLRKQSE